MLFSAASAAVVLSAKALRVSHSREEPTFTYLKLGRTAIAATFVLSLSGCADMAAQIIADVIINTAVNAAVDGVGSLVDSTKAESADSSALRELTCAEEEMEEVRNPEQRIYSAAFSVVPPDGDNWCLTHQSDVMVGFATNPFMGKYVPEKATPEELSHAFAAIASAQRTIEQIETPEAFRDFVEQWLHKGMGSTMERETIHVSFSPELDIKVVSLQVNVDRSLGHNYVRYEIETEQNNASTYLHWTLTKVMEGFVCKPQHPEGLIVVTSFSEKYRKGWEDRDLALRNALRKGFVTMLHSVQF